MGKIYKNQTALTIKLDTKTILENVQTALIKYKKPNGAIGSFSGSIGGGHYGTLITYDVLSADDLDQSGKWTFWAHITFTNGKIVPGERVFVKIYEEGNS